VSAEHQLDIPRFRTRFFQLLLLLWIALIGVDFLLHGGVFAAIYEQDSPFLLAAEEAFRRIPFGYAALLITVGLLVWIIGRTQVRGWRKGLALGLALGLVMAASSTLGLYSISTASPEFLAAFFTAQVVEIGIAGAIIGHGLLVQSLRRLTLAVIAGFVLLFAATILIQNTG
jgi:hypothetical protein